MLTLSDIRLTFRMLCRAPAVTAIAILSIGIGVGATAVVFAAVKKVLIQPFPYSHPEELVQIRTDFAGGGNPRQDWVSWNDMQDVARENHSFSALGTYHYAIFNLAGAQGGEPTLIAAAVALVASTAAMACWIPARRATCIDPVAALRQE